MRLEQYSYCFLRTTKSDWPPLRSDYCSMGQNSGMENFRQMALPADDIHSNCSQGRFPSATQALPGHEYYTLPREQTSAYLNSPVNLARPDKRALPAVWIAGQGSLPAVQSTAHFEGSEADYSYPEHELHLPAAGRETDDGWNFPQY